MKYLTVLVVLCLVGCKESTLQKKTKSFDYPETKQVDTVDVYFGTEVKDPYRWLEDDRSGETAAWVAAQNEVTFDYLEKIPYREELKKRLSELWDYEKLTAPFERGGYTYYYRNDGLQNHSVVYRKSNEEGAGEEVFLDPNGFSEDGTTSLAGLSFTEDGALAAYSISEGGSDWRKVIVIDTESMEQIGDTLRNIKFSGISWRGNEGFYYSKYDMPDGSHLSEKTDRHILYFHELETAQDEDEAVFGASEEERGRYIGGSVTEDGRYLIINRAQSTSGNELYIKDLSGDNSPIVPIITGYEYTSYVADNDGSRLYIVTDLGAPNRRVVTVDAAAPAVKNWEDLIPETQNVLTLTTGKGYLFARYMIDAVSKVHQYGYDGELIREIELPGVGTVSGFSGKKDDQALYYSFTNYNTPSRIYAYDEGSGQSELYWQPDIDFNPEDYLSEQVFYESKDSTRIPMIITYKKGTQRDGQTPTILYGYGGFNISLTPSFSVVNAVWMEQGGIYAVPNLRGGGEYGREWHDAGTKMNKQNVFDDFIAAAEFLVENLYTSPEYLAVSGRSNGGLLVGATVNQRPDLMAVGLPGVGVMDMLRYHTFTAGAGWAYDYGTSEDSREMFEYLKSYSPVHNVREGENYPAILVTTADHDDRVVPAHSFKYAAALQAVDTGPNPKLIRIETKAGHGAGKPVSMTIAEWADIYSFVLYNMGFKEHLSSKE